jgi:3-oxoacyl-[acyl-carrier-protein] synthase-3
MSANDVDFVVPHKANWRIIDAIRAGLNIPSENVCVTINKHGNTSASSSISHEILVHEFATFMMK